MDNNKLLLEILRASLKNEKTGFTDDMDIDWQQVLESANSHQITSLVYNSIDRDYFEKIDKKIINDWKSNVIKLNMLQIYKVSRFYKILSDLNKLNIEVIALKGIVIRNYYPRPELRTMGDLDILVHKDDYCTVKEYILKSGFSIANDDHPIHTEFIDKSGISVEVHWKLINNETYAYDTANFEKNIWCGIEKFKINSTTINILGKEDFLLHLCIHMAKHLRGTGFGLRQVYDVAAFCIKEGKNIDWIKFEEKAIECGALKFSITLFKLINYIFNLDLYENIINKNLSVDCDIVTLLDEILSYDVFKNGERKICLSKISLKDDKLLSYKKIHNQYTLVKRNISNIFKDNTTKEIINRRKILLKEFNL